jgi:RNA polymerase-binding transcription factor DksA
MAKKTTKKATKKTAAKKSPPKKAPVKKAVKKVTQKKSAKKVVKKPAPRKVTKKAPKKKATQPAAKKTAKKVVKKTSSKTTSMTTKKAAKKVTRKSTKKVAVKKVARKTVAKKAVKKQVVKKLARKVAGSTNKKIALKKASVERSDADGSVAKGLPTSFSLDEVEAVIAARKSREPEKTQPKLKKKAVKVAKKVAKKKAVDLDKIPVKKRVHAPASLTDILGFNPSEKKKTVSEEAAAIPRKWKKYYKLLLELRRHLQEELDLHTSDTLMHSAREDAGDLSNYGNHQADAGTDSFDRDFALSLVSNEQDALYEIEEAIRRMIDGVYGVCEQTGEPIKKERLEAVPFARFSLEGQKEYEKNNRRKTDRVVEEIFSDNSDAPKIVTDDD